MQTAIYLMVQLPVVLLLAPLVNGIILKIKALTQKRRGAPVLQLYFDLYKLLKKNVVAIFGGILAGTLGHLVTIVLLGAFLRLDSKIIISALSKSVTMPIALGISGEVGGIEAVTIVGVTIAGLTGAIFGPFILKVFKIQEPIAQGLAIGTASHAMGTSKMVEVGQVQAAMSSVAIVITGLLTVILVPIYLSI